MPGDELGPNEADYRHGSELVGKAFRDFLLRQVVDFKFENGMLHMSIGATRVRFVSHPDWVPPELKKAMESQGARLIARVSDVITDS